MQDVVRFWLERGAAGYRVDAIDRLLKDPKLRDDPPATEPYGLPLREDEAKLALTHSRNAPDTGAALARIREAAGDAFLVGEVYLPSARWQPYSDHFDAVFAFELLHASWDAEELRRAIEATTRQAGAAWALSNHDFGRLPTRFGRENARAAAMLLLTLPGTAFLYQGDEIGQADGPGGEREFDRAGRDRFRHPMQWDASPGGGFSDGEPWLPLVEPERHNVEAERDDPDSMLTLVRRLIRRARASWSRGWSSSTARPVWSPSRAAGTRWPSTRRRSPVRRPATASSYWRPVPARSAAGRWRPTRAC